MLVQVLDSKVIEGLANLDDYTEVMAIENICIILRQLPDCRS